MKKKSAARKQSRDMVYDYIFKKILDGSIRFGTRLTELALAGELGVSRTPVHDALAKLVHKGIAVYAPGNGIYLKEITRVDIQELVALRRLYETYATGIAAARTKPYFLVKMEESCNILRQLGLDIRAGKAPSLNEQWRIKNNAEILFHFSIIQATGNSQLIRVFSDTLLLTQILCTMELNNQSMSLGLVANIYWGHSKLLRLIKKGRKEQAIAFMGYHIDEGLKTLLTCYDEKEPAPVEESDSMNLYETLY